MQHKVRIALAAGAVGALVAGLLTVGAAGAAASGKVIGMTSGGGSKGHLTVDVGPGLSGMRRHETMTITSPISNVQCSKASANGRPIDCPAGSSIVMNATLSTSSASCESFTTGPSTWTGTATISWPGSTGTASSITLSKYTLTFSGGVLYATGKASAADDHVKDGSETDLDAFTVPAGFACSSTSVLSTLDLVSIIKITFG